MATIHGAVLDLAPTDEVRGQPADASHMNRVITELAVAFAHDVDIAYVPNEPVEAKWPMAWTIVAVAAASAALWAGIAGLIILFV